MGGNKLPTMDENITAKWSEVTNEYKRRADVIPNLVAVVQGYASHEQETLRAVTEARASATSFKITPEVLNDPAAFKKFEQAQGQLSQALSRLMMVQEKYPDLKADKGFRDLQAQIEGTENRITVARGRYIKAVQEYNATVRTFPTVMMAKLMGFGTKQNFAVDDIKKIEDAPPVKFGKS